MPGPKLAMNQVSTGVQSFEDDVAQCAAAGYEGIGIAPRKLDDVGMARAKQLLADAGLAVSTYTTTSLWHGRDLGDGSPSRHIAQPDWEEVERLRPRLIELTKRDIELAAEIGASCTMLLTGWAGPLDWEDATDRFLDSVDQLLPTAEACEMPLACEALASIFAAFSHIHTMRDLLDVVERVDSPYFGVTLDTWHVWAERDLIGQIERGVDKIFLCQIDDFYADTASWSERAQLGEGVIPLPRIFRALRDAGYGGFYDLELFPARLDDAGRASLVADSRAAFDRIWASVEADAARDPQRPGPSRARGRTGQR